MNADDNLGFMVNNMPFINDDDVIGKWKYYDIIQSEEQFVFNKTKSKIANKGFREIYFLPNGQKYWIFEGWTKGFLFTHFGGDEPVNCNKYTIRKINNEMYMFLEVYADTSKGEEPYINVLKKVSSPKYDLSEIGRRDNIDLPFVMDENIIGLWKSVDVVDNISDFIVNEPKLTTLWLKSVCFNEDGTVVRIYDNDEWHDFWTKGVLIDKKKATASAYKIKLINNKEYLFIEWKMGNYSYGGVKPEYFVFERCDK